MNNKNNEEEVLPITHVTLGTPGLPIKIKYKPGAHKLEKTDRGDWIDLYTYKDTFLPKDEFIILDLGVAIELPSGYEAILAPRSSTFKRWGLLQANSIGIFDETFCGNDDIWGMPVIALQKDVFIPKDTRLCQFRVFKHQPPISFIEVDDLGNENRGGWGSSGV